MPSDLIVQLVNDGTDDWVPLIRVENRVRWAAEDAGAEADPTSVRERSLRLINELLAEGLMEAGDMPQGSGYQPWDVPVADAMARIEEAWAPSGGADWSFAVWLSNTAAGDTLAERYPLDESNLPDALTTPEPRAPQDSGQGS